MGQTKFVYTLKLYSTFQMFLSFSNLILCTMFYIIFKFYRGYGLIFLLLFFLKKCFCLYGQNTNIGFVNIFHHLINTNTYPQNPKQLKILYFNVTVRLSINITLLYHFEFVLEKYKLCVRNAEEIFIKSKLSNNF